MPILNKGNWHGNQNLQNAFCKALENINIKVAGSQRDPHSGGPRTYFSQLKMLGLIYSNTDGHTNLTRAGDALSQGIEPLKVLQTQLLAHQYPSFYAKGPNVRIHPNIQIKPFVFILQLLHDDQIKYLTNEEFIIPLIYGHNQACYDICKIKILELRKTQDLLSVIDDHQNDTYTPRGAKSPIENRLKNNIKHIANTCQNYLQAACLISPDKTNKYIRYHFNTDFEALYQEHETNKNNFIPNHTNEESFQRAYGSWDKKKDTRKQKQQKQMNRGENIITAEFMRHCGTSPVGYGTNENFVNKLHKKYGFDKKLVEETIAPYENRTLDIFEAHYLDLAVGSNKTALDFEKATANLLRTRMGLEVEETGQKKRSKGVGGYSDLLVYSKNKQNCAIIDTKASNSYSLPSTDYHKMASNYVPNVGELTQESECTLELCTYVAGGFKGNIKKRLAELAGETSTQTSAIKARKLLQIAKTANHEEDNFELLKSTLL